jgi:hypothetical protein
MNSGRLLSRHTVITWYSQACSYTRLRMLEGFFCGDVEAQDVDLGQDSIEARNVAMGNRDGVGVFRF